ncbi:MAG TPA: NAD(P)/FAD-dependent oxidoreductase [Caulobacteraceae bacterium]|jgi:monoamine oxidase|nr:NAD(P)/FAD-dependent oxidoreductase [Caulobacteraceae bacterium]
MSFATEVDICVVGGGAAGIAAVRRLKGAPVSTLLVEARPRLGGRAHTVEAGGFPVDLGCGWLHSADENAWTGVAEALGLTLDKTPPPWRRQAFNLQYPPEEQQAYRQAFDALEQRIEAAVAGPDRPVSELLEPGSRWNARLNAFSGAYNGAPFSDISVHDYHAYEDTGTNWRIREGYGTTVATFGRDLPMALGAPVTRIEHDGPRLRLVTADGILEARAVIVAVPAAVIASGRLSFDPPLADKVAAAEALPLGHVNKAFLTLSEPELLPAETTLVARFDTARTGAYHLRPFGRPLIEGFFGGDLAAELEGEGEAAFGAFAIEELVSLLGSDFRRKARFLTASTWAREPWTGGAYSHARPGHAGARAVLAAPVEERLFFAGEACSPHHFSTAHGAYETGVAAAEAALKALRL